MELFDKSAHGLIERGLKKMLPEHDVEYDQVIENVLGTPKEE